MPLSIAKPRRSSALLGQRSLGLSSLQATLAKLEHDKGRHEQLVGSLASRMSACRQSLVHAVQAHKSMSFHQSGYVFVRVLGAGRHGTMKLAKKKSNAYVKHTKAAVDNTRGTKIVSDFVAVRIVNKTQAGADKESLSSKESHATLMRHVQALREMDHPNIQRAIETFEDSQHIYLVLELYTGKDLLDHEDAPLSEERVAWIINQVCSALAHAHGKGIVHQDVRPDNVNYASSSKDARCVLTDWSCCEFINTPARDARQHLILSEYSAPELEPCHRTDRADTWSLGVTAFALLGLSLPFGDHGPRPKVGDLEWFPSDPKVSNDCCDFLKKLVKVHPAYRLSAVQALAHPWLSSARLVHRGDRLQALQTSVASSLLRFKESTVLQRAAAALVADHISGEQLYELTQQFYALDKDGDGTIEKTDMVEALRNTVTTERAITKIGLEDVDHEELAEDIEGLLKDNSKVIALVNLMDMDGDGKISYSEFLAAASEASLSTCTELAWEAFRAFDANGDGYVLKKELSNLFESDAMSELISMLKAASVGGAKTKNREELESAIAEIGGAPLSVDEMFSKADEDHSGQITFDEFLKLFVG